MFSAPQTKHATASAVLYDKPRLDDSQDPTDDMEQRLSRAHTIDKQIKHRVRVLRAIARCFGAIASAFVLGIMANTLFVFSTHKTTTTANGTFIQVYPKMPLLWPTYMMLATGGISLLFDLAVIVAYCCSMCSRRTENKVASANTVDNYHSKVGYVISATNFVVWLATSTTFKMMQGPAAAVPPPNDLFGFSCSDASDALQPIIGKFVNFDFQCKTQTASFGVGLLNAGLQLLGLVINIFAVRRLLNKRRMQRLESRTQNAQSF